MERIAYLIKSYIPFLFPLIERTAARVTRIRYGRRIRHIQDKATVTGTIDEKPAVIRPLTNESDAQLLSDFLIGLSADHIAYFRPHSFEVNELVRIIKDGATLMYGLFKDDSLIGYALLKATPTGSLYRGRIVGEKYCGRGIGKVLGEYLNWQTTLLNMRVRSTVSKHNIASRSSFGPSAEVKVVNQLPNEFEMLEFRGNRKIPPILNIAPLKE